MSEKVTGYILLSIGLIVILYSAIDVFLVFTKQKQPVQLFNFEAITFDPSSFTPNVEVPGELSQFVRPQPTRQPEQVELISPDIINQSSNVFAHIMLMGFIASIGGRISSIGTQLVRTIDVHIRTKHTSNT